ncbi:MAG: hypothetical protein V1712_04160, partial [Patescibacteria group bacterium]
SVTLTATLNGTTFGGWSGVTCSGGNTSNPCIFTLSAATTVTANFTAAGPFTLTVEKFDITNGEPMLATQGLVVSSPTGINCGSTCSYSFASNTIVTLTATNTTSFIFDSWVDCNSFSGNTCTVNMTSAKSVTANYISNY